MEIRGVLETLKFFKTPVRIKIYSDSQLIQLLINMYINDLPKKIFLKRILIYDLNS